MNINLPIRVKFIIDKFRDNGFEAFAVGGCIRDSLLNITPKDWDITTNALPEDIISIFPRSIPTGLKHGTITIIVDNECFEVTTYRIEEGYKDFRRPSSVKFVTSINEDLSRRDFTINSMAYNPTLGLIDPFNGTYHLEKKIITCVGDATKRFNEDALRMLRALRFSSQLNFSIEENTLKALINHKHLIKNVSKERITEEISKLLLSTDPSKGLLYLSNTDIISEILGANFCNVHSLINSLKDTKDKLSFKYSLFIYYLCKDNIDINKILQNLRLDNKTLNLILCLNKNKGFYNKLLSKYDIKLFINKIGLDSFQWYLDFEEIILKTEKSIKDLMKLNIIREAYIDILNNNEPITLRDLKINGSHIKDLGLLEGKKVGIILNNILHEVLKNPKLNNKDTLISMVKSNIKL